MIDLIEADILNFDVQYIAHQTNCVSDYALGLAKLIFKKYPYADDYRNRPYENYMYELGSINIHIGEQNVINMFAQIYPGKPCSPKTVDVRQTAFKECLTKISKIPDLKSIAFPYRIGCGLAGGDWQLYEQMLNSFAEEVKQTKVFILHNM